MTVYYIIPFLAALIHVSLFLFIILNRPWQKQHKLLALYLVTAVFWTLSSFFLQNSNFFAEDKLLLFRIVIAISMWWAVQLYYFVRSFLGLPGGWAVRFCYISMAVFIIAAFLGTRHRESPLLAEWSILSMAGGLFYTSLPFLPSPAWVCTL